MGLRRRGRLPEPLQTVHADLTDPGSLRAVTADPDLLLYLPSPDSRDEVAYRRVFIDGLRTLLEALSGTPRRVVFVSSTAVYGDLDGDWGDEETPAHPQRFNGRILFEAERWVSALATRSVILRLGGIYGPGREALVRRVRSGTPCREGGWSNRIHAVDAARALVHLATLADPAPCYLGVDHEPTTDCTVLRWLARHLGLPEPPVDTAAAAGDPKRKRLRNRRLCATGFTFSYPSFREGYAQLTDARSG